MTAGRLLWRSLWFHRQAHLAVLLGIAVGAAVLAGALLAGDSLRGSLRRRAERQRAGVDFALISPRFIKVRETQRPDAGVIRHQIILLKGTAAAGERSTGSATIYGVPNGFLSLAMPDHGAILPASLARELGLAAGDALSLRHPKASALPRESLLGHRDESRTTVAWSLPVAAVIDEEAPAAVFQLAPGSGTPRNIYVPLSLLQEKCELDVEVNAILAIGGNRAEHEQWLDSLDSAGIWGWKVVPRGAYLSVETEQSILEPAVADAAVQAAEALGWRAEPTLVYLANSIAHADQSIPYSIVAALNPTASAPLGPFVPPGVPQLRDDEIILADWADSPLKDVPIGAPIALTYFAPELRDGRLVETTATFRLKGRVPLTGVAADPHLTPPFPGVTDRLTIRQWDPPFPYDNRRIAKRDEDFWKTFKTTPKAYVTLSAGQSIWASKYGGMTSLRLAPEGSHAKPAASIPVELARRLRPGDHGFVFEDLRARTDAASQGAQDFGGLFLGFSFFLIIAALLLVGLMTRLSLDRRASEIGLLLATGWNTRQIRRLLLVEGMLVAVLGASLGLAGAVGFAWLMVQLLVRLWPDQSVGTFLQLQVDAVSLLAGWAGAVAMSGGAIFWTLQALRHVAPTALLAGATQLPESRTERSAPWLRWAVAAVGAIGGIAALVAGPRLDNPMYRALGFFLGGALILTALLALLLHFLKRERPAPITRRGPWAMVRLGVRNASRNPGRSLLTAGLLAVAAFLLVAVESFRRQPERDFLQRHGGSGGFPLLLQTNLPIYNDLNGAGRDEMLDALRMQYQRQPDPAGRTISERADEAQRLLQQCRFFSLRVRAGDDASCLNLYQAGKPRLVGAPRSLRDRGGFRFVALLNASAEERANPWKLLDRDLESDVVPVIAEENTVTWMLKLGLGGEFAVRDGQGKPMRLRIVGLLKDSVFQSEVIMAEEAFTRLFPREEGRTLHLIETPTEQVEATAAILRRAMTAKGADVIHTPERVATFMAVENTYLTTFQLLGGFGLVLGALGLAAVMLRGIWERRGELALLRAIGFRLRTLAELVMVENVLLLLCGLGAGVGAAFVSVAPQAEAGGSASWVRLSVLLGGATVTGVAAGLWAVRGALRVPLLPALRKE